MAQNNLRRRIIAFGCAFFLATLGCGGGGSGSSSSDTTATVKLTGTVLGPTTSSGDVVATLTAAGEPAHATAIEYAVATESGEADFTACSLDPTGCASSLGDGSYEVPGVDYTPVTESAVCGDLICSTGEESSCVLDCGTTSDPSDYDATCGDSLCEDFEAFSCPTDCTSSETFMRHRLQIFS